MTWLRCDCVLVRHVEDEISSMAEYKGCQGLYDVQRGSGTLRLSETV